MFTSPAFSQRSPEEIKTAVRGIVDSCTSDDEIRSRIKTELGYPYSEEGIAVTSHRNEHGAMYMLMLHHESGTISM